MRDDNMESHPEMFAYLACMHQSWSIGPGLLRPGEAFYGMCNLWGEYAFFKEKSLFVQKSLDVLVCGWYIPAAPARVA